MIANLTRRFLRSARLTPGREAPACNGDESGRRRAYVPQPRSPGPAPGPTEREKLLDPAAVGLRKTVTAEVTHEHTSVPFYIDGPPARVDLHP